MIKYAFILAIALIVTTTISAQENKAFTEAVKLYDARNYSSAEKEFLKALNVENAKPNTDIAIRASIYNYLGLCSILQIKFTDALDYYNLSAADFREVKDYPSLASVLKNISDIYQIAPKRFFESYTPVDSSALTNEVFFKVTQIDFQNEDSVTVTIQGGIDMGIFTGAKGSLMFSYNSKREKTNSNYFVANAQVITVTEKEAVIGINFLKKQPPGNKKIFPGDLVVLKLYEPEEKIKSIYYNLTALDILFVNAYKDTLLSKQAILNSRDKELEKTLTDYYIYDFHDFYTSYMEEQKDTVYNTPYKTGRFKGMTMKDAFKYAEPEDLYAFFNFVKSFPAKYMGKAWKLNETYATWVLNNMPEGETGRQWLLPFINNTPLNKIDSFANKFSWYLQKDSLPAYITGLNDLYSAGKMEEALILCNKLYRLARLIKNKSAETDFVLYRSYIDDKLGFTADALKDARTAFLLNPQLINAATNLGYLYGKANYYDSCINILEPLVKNNPGRYDIAGNLGWYKMLTGKWKEAEQLCKTAYDADKNSYSYAVNYGHTFLLKGNLDSAKIYYAKTLENLYYPNDYADGPKKDFETFFAKGWNRSGVAASVDWMDEQYNNKYSYITKGNLVWDVAKKLYEAKKYRVAAEKWKEYIEVFNGMKEPPLLYIHNTYTWIGSCYEDARDLKLAEKYYQMALEMAKDTFSNTDKLSADYKRLFNFYNSAGNTIKAREFKLMHDVEKQKLDDSKARPHLFLLAVEGKNNLQPESKDNAKTFFESVKSTVNNSFDSLHTFYVEKNNLTKKYVLGIMDSIKKQSKPEDVLLFYYTGTVSSENKTNYYLLKEDAVNADEYRMTEDEMMDAVKNIGTQKKLIISDVPAPGILGKISEGYSAESYALNEVIFICPGVLTPVKISSGISAFTEQLTAAVKDLSKKNKFTAKDLVAKTSDGLGVNKYYLPVLSFAYAKDFVLYKNEQTRGEEILATRSTIDEPVNEKEGADKIPAGEGRNYALLVATDQYSELKQLSNPVFDATELGKILKDDFGFDTSMLINGTRDDMEARLTEYRDNKIYGPNDQLFIFFAGHGIYYENAKMGYLAAKDSRKNDPTHKTYLSYSDLGNLYLKNIKCNRIFVVLDACFAGSFFDQATVRGDNPDAASLEILKRNASGKRFFKGISSGAKEYVPDGRLGQHSPFAASFISNLANKAYNSRVVTADVLIATIKSNPPSETQVSEGKFNYCDPTSHFIFELKTQTTGTPQIKSDSLKN